MSHTNHYISRPSTRRASPWGSPDPDQEVVEEVRRRVAKRMRQCPTLSGNTADEGSSSDDEDQPATRHKNLKSGMDRTGATNVLNKITCPHEVLYTSDGKPVSYQDITAPQFVYGYLIVMDSEVSDHKVKMAAYLKDLISDAQLYCWDRIQAFHGFWLNQLQQGRCTCFDEDIKMQFHRSLIWHPACLSASHSTTTRTSCRTRRQNHSQVSYNAPVKHGAKACRDYNHGKCDNKSTHANLQHICSYCLGAVKRGFLPLGGSTQ